MRKNFVRLATLGIVFLSVALACNYPSVTATEASNVRETALVATLSIMLTSAASAPVAATLAPGETAVPAASSLPTDTSMPPTDTSVPSATPTPQNPLVLRDTLCWVGPGNQYEVVSSLKKDARVELLGKGSVAGWWIVVNPIYHDPCWVQATDLQIEAGTDLSNLKIYYPPPTPTSTPTNTPTPTATP